MIMNWRQFWGICEHKWKVINNAKIIGNETSSTLGHIYILQCEKCGDLKTKKVLA